MGTYKNIQPAQLPAKLRAIRRYIGLTQEEMIKYIVPETDDARAIRSKLSEFESGARSPSLQQTLNYAKAVIALTRHKNFLVEYLIDDNLALPFTDSATDHPADKSDRGRETNSVASAADRTAIRELQNVDCSEENAADEQPASFLAGTGDYPPDSADSHFKLFDQLYPVAGSESAAGPVGDNTLRISAAQPRQPGEPGRRKYPRVHHFSREQLMNFDDFRLRLLLVVEHEQRAEWGDSSAALEIAIAAALLDLENHQRGVTSESLILTLLQTDVERDN